MKNYYFTFGLGTPLKDVYVIISANSRERAIKCMNMIFTSFAGVYEEEYWLHRYDVAMSEKYNLCLLKAINAEEYIDD